MTIVSWLMATRRPRCWAGAISEMYIGEMFDAKPMLTPPMIRQVTNTGKLPAKAIPSDDTTKFDTARMRIVRRTGR